MSHVLVIDDDPCVTRLLEEHLSNEGHEIFVAHLAEEGIDLATRKPPELIFLDVMLPDATGFQVLARLRQNPVTRSIPIIMMTGTARYPNQQQIGKSMGANEYLLKPFDVLSLGDRIKNLITTQREKLSLGEMPPAAVLTNPFMKEPPPAMKEHLMPVLEAEPIPEPMPDLTQEPELEPAPEPVLETIPEPEPNQEPFSQTYEPLTPIPEVFIPREPSIAASEPEGTAVESVHFEHTPLPEPAAVPEYPVPAKFVREPIRLDFMSEPEKKQPEPERIEEVIETKEPSVSPTAKPLSFPVKREPTPASLYPVASLFMIHLSLVGIMTMADASRAMTVIAAGWVLLLGLITGACALFRIYIESRQALRLLGWVAIPIVIRTAANLFGVISDPGAISDKVFWQRPLDVFELTSCIILGLFLQKIHGNSLKKTILAVCTAALAWMFCARGYFRPF